MKNIYIIVITLLFLSGCSRWIAPPFTNVERLSAVKVGMSLDEVNEKLGIEPYDVYFKGQDGIVVVYNYRIKDLRIRKNEGSILYNKSDVRVKGEDWYGQKYYCYIFFVDNQMKSIITDEGKVKSEDILIKNNNIFLINNDKIGFYHDNDTIVFVPMKKQ